MKHLSSMFVVATLVAAGAGCVKPSVYTTSNLTVPVMIGPVKNLQAQQPTGGGRPASAVAAEIANVFFVSSERHQDGFGNKYTTTTVAGLEQGATDFDRAFGEALATCASCTPKTDRIHVGSYDIYLLFSLMEKNWAGIEGSLTGW